MTCHPICRFRVRFRFRFRFRFRRRFGCHPLVPKRISPEVANSSHLGSRYLFQEPPPPRRKPRRPPKESPAPVLRVLNEKRQSESLALGGLRPVRKQSGVFGGALIVLVRRVTSPHLR